MDLKEATESDTVSYKLTLCMSSVLQLGSTLTVSHI